MSEIFTKDHYKVFQLLSQNDFTNALECINKVEKTTGLDYAFKILKTYTLVELQNYTEAEKLVPAPKDKKFVYFMKRIYKALNKIKDYKSISKDCMEEQYEASVLSDDFHLCKNMGIKLLSRSPVYLIFALALSYNSGKSHFDLKLLQLSLNKYFKHPNVFIFLVKLDILVDYVITLVEKISIKNMTYFCLLKEIFIRYKEHRAEIINLLKGQKLANDMASAMEFFIEKFDDWKFYKEALDEGIELKETKRQNYLFYKLLKTRDQQVASELCSKIGSFREASRVLSLVHGHGSATTDLRALFSLQEEFSEDVLRGLHDIYAKDPSLLNTKLLLANLVGSKREKYLILALYISRETYSSFDTYEVKLIYLFLCRFFCLLPEVLDVMDNLEIKTIQQENLGFVWNDLCIFLGQRQEARISRYLNGYYDQIRKTNEYVMPFISAGKLDYALDLIQLRKDLLKSNIHREVSEQRIFSESPKNMFSEFLGPKCSYLFDKLHVNSGKSDFRIKNIYGKNEDGGVIDEFLQNDLHDLSCKANFKAWFFEQAP